MLTLSRTAGYAILALSCLVDAGGRWVLVREIASRVKLPAPYLAKILHALAKMGVVKAKRGYRGGFMLARPAEKISIEEIVEVIEGHGWLDGCMLGFTQCTDERACPAHALCKAERATIKTFLFRLTLKDVADFELRKGALPVVKVDNGLHSARSDTRGRKRAGRASGKKGQRRKTVRNEAR